MTRGDAESLVSHYVLRLLNNFDASFNDFCAQFSATEADQCRAAYETFLTRLATHGARGRQFLTAKARVIHQEEGTHVAHP